MGLARISWSPQAMNVRLEREWIVLSISWSLLIQLMHNLQRTSILMSLELSTQFIIMFLSCRKILLQDYWNTRKNPVGKSLFNGVEYPNLLFEATWAAKSRPQAFPHQASALHWINAGSWRVIPT
jgi:hypothetical protein